MSAITAFHAGQAPDARGRTRQDILAWDDGRLEAVHDYIQWLFPLPERSAFNPNAPVLTQADRDAFAADTALRANLAEAHDRMLRFYGLTTTPPDPARLRAWVTPGNHNFLRITRVLRCLTLLGLPDRAALMLAALQDVYAGHASVIGARTLQFWTAAVRPG